MYEYGNIDKIYQRKINQAREGVSSKFEDEDQIQAQEEIFEMLLAAGIKFKNSKKKFIKIDINKINRLL